MTVIFPRAVVYRVTAPPGVKPCPETVMIVPTSVAESVEIAGAVLVHDPLADPATSTARIANNEINIPSFRKPIPSTPYLTNIFMPK